MRLLTSEIRLQDAGFIREGIAVKLRPKRSVEGMNKKISYRRFVNLFLAFAALGLSLSWVSTARAQSTTVGAITGTVLDASGAAVPDAVVKAHNVATNLEVPVHSDSSGSYSISNLPVGTYELSFTKSGFETETHTRV